jgi:FMN phosphatase YigB (HAD superfamily)
LFEGLTFCDYAQETMICKPHPEMFAKAMKEAGVKEFKDCYFVGKRSFEGLETRTNRHRRFSSKL